jgi:hypothetical protein
MLLVYFATVLVKMKVSEHWPVCNKGKRFNLGFECQSFEQFFLCHWQRGQINKSFSLTNPYQPGISQALIASVRQGCKCLPETNTGLLALIMVEE